MKSRKLPLEAQYTRADLIRCRAMEAGDLTTAEMALKEMDRLEKALARKQAHQPGSEALKSKANR
jgi:hypothetical protein